MAQFYKHWIKEKFGKDYEVQCDELVTEPRSILQRLDTHTFIRDHEQRGKDIFHFYLTYSRPLWTDSLCDGYHAENFGLVFWKAPKESDDLLFLAEKNCTTVSYELLHELMRQSGEKKHAQRIRDVWTRHFYEQLEFEQYGEDFKTTDGKPMFLTMNTLPLNLEK